MNPLLCIYVAIAQFWDGHHELVVLFHYCGGVQLEVQGSNCMDREGESKPWVVGLSHAWDSWQARKECFQRRCPTSTIMKRVRARATRFYKNNQENVM